MRNRRILGCDSIDLAMVRDAVMRAKTSFGIGMRVLQPDRRYAMFAIYAFCRAVDDIADGDAHVPDRARALADWHARIERLYHGQAEDALDRVLLCAISTYGLAQADFDAVIDGMAMDAGDPIVAPDEATLDLYCDRVASAVGRLSVRVFGDSSEDAMRVAYHLGRALQLTNILRDVQEDAERGRLYLPRELLVRFSVPFDPQEALYARGLDPLARIMAARASDHFAQARKAMLACSSRAMLPARMMAASYRPILGALTKRGWKVPQEKLRMPKWRRILSSVMGFVR